MFTITSVSELVTYLPHSRPLGFEAPLLNIVVDAVEFLHAGVELLLPLTEAGLTSKEASRALVLFFSIWALFVSSLLCHCHLVGALPQIRPFLALLWHKS